MVTLRLMVKRKDRKRAGNYCPEIRRKILRSKDTIVTRAQRARAQNRRARRLAETAARTRQAEEARGTTRESRTGGREGHHKERRVYQKLSKNYLYRSTNHRSFEQSEIRIKNNYQQLLIKKRVCQSF